MMNSPFSKFLLVSVVVFSACGHSSEETETPDAASSPVEVAWSPVLSLKPSKRITFPGELKPWNQVGIYAKVNGFVRTILVDRGTHVRKGQVLAVLDAPEIHSELSQIEAQKIAAQAALSQQMAHLAASGATYDRLLHANRFQEGSISVNEIDQARSKAWSDSAAVAAARENLKAAEALYKSKSEFASYLTLTAPFDGTIIERNVSPGALVGRGEAGKPLFVLEDSRTLRLTVAVPESFAGSLPLQARVSFSVTAFPDKQFSARLARSAGSVLEHNRAMMVEFDTDNHNGLLKSGMYANVSLPVIRQDSTLFVPATAVVTSSEQVFVIRSKNGLAEWVGVRKGVALDSLVEVFGDLHAGDRIVRSASEEIREGDSLRLAALR